MAKDDYILTRDLVDNNRFVGFTAVFDYRGFQLLTTA